MSRFVPAFALAILTLACSGAMGVVPWGERTSSATLQFPEGATEASGALLAFDPTRHSLDISIELPLEQTDDIDVFIIPSSGVRYQVLGSFHECEVDGASRTCPRQLPAFPAETVDNWTVAAQRPESQGATRVEVAIAWQPVGD